MDSGNKIHGIPGDPVNSTECNSVNSPHSLITDDLIDESSEKNGNTLVKPTFKSILQAKKRLQAFSSNKQLLAHNSPKKPPDESDKSEKLCSKKSKKEIYPDEKFKNTIKEIEDIKMSHIRPPSDKQILDQINKLNMDSVPKQVFSFSKPASTSTEMENQFRKVEVKSRNYRRTDDIGRESPAPESKRSDKRKEVYPLDWTEYKNRRFTTEKHLQIKPKTNTEYAKFFSFETPSPSIGSYKYKTERGDICMVPFKHIRQTKAKPHLNYNINYQIMKDNYMTKKQLFNFIPSSRIPLIEKLYNESSKIQPLNSKLVIRKWYPKSWKKADNVEGKLLENSVGLSFLQSYSDEEDNLDDSFEIVEEAKEVTKVKENHQSPEKIPKEEPMEKTKKLLNNDWEIPDIQEVKNTKDDWEVVTPPKVTENRNIFEDEKKCHKERNLPKLPDVIRSKTPESRKTKDETENKTEDEKSEKKKKKKKEKKKSKSEEPEKTSKKKSKKKKKSTEDVVIENEREKKKKKKKKHKIKKIKDKKLKEKKKKLKAEKRKKSKSESKEEDVTKESIDRQKYIEDLMEKIDHVEKIKSRKEKKLKESDVKDNSKPKIRRSKSNESFEYVEKKKDKNKEAEDDIRSSKRSKSSEDLRDFIDKSKSLKHEKPLKKEKEKIAKKDKPVKRNRSVSTEKISKLDLSNKKKDKEPEKEKKKSKPKEEEKFPLEKYSTKKLNEKSGCSSEESRTPVRGGSKISLKEAGKKQIEGGTPDTEGYNSHWESDDDIPVVTVTKELNTSWESDEEVFERYYPLERDREPAAKPYVEANLEIPLNIKPFSRRGRGRSRWDETAPSLDEELKLLKRESRTLSEERKRLEKEKIKVQQLELQYENLERTSKRKFEHDKKKYEEIYRNYKESKGSKRSSDKYEVLEVDLSKVKKENVDDGYDMINISSSTDFDISTTPNALENEYEEFMKAVTPADRTRKKTKRKDSTSSSDDSSSDSSDSNSSVTPPHKPIKIKVEKSPTRGNVTPKVVPNFKIDELLPADLLTSTPKPKKADAPPHDIPLPKSLPLPVPVPSPQLDNLPKPLLNINMPPLIDLNLNRPPSPHSSLMNPPAPTNKVSSPVVKNVENIPSPPVKNVAASIVKNVASPVLKNVASPLVANVASPLFTNVASPVLKDFEHSSSPIGMNVTSPLIRNIEVLTPATQNVDVFSSPTIKNVISPIKSVVRNSNIFTTPTKHKLDPASQSVNLASPLTDTSIDSNCFEGIEDAKKPFNFALPVKKLLIDNSNLNLNDDSDEDNKRPLRITLLNDIKKEQHSKDLKHVDGLIILDESPVKVKEAEKTPARKRERSRSPVRPRDDRRHSRSPRRRHSPARRGRESPGRSRGGLGRRSRSPRGRRLSPLGSRRRRSPSPRRGKRRSISPKRKLSPKRRSISPKNRPTSPKRRKSSPKPQSLVKEKQTPVSEPVRIQSSPMGGLKKSVADSTISDDLLPQPNNVHDDYTESPVSRFYERNRILDSPKRLPLDIRINQLVGLQKPEVQPPQPTPYGTYNQYNQYSSAYVYGQSSHNSPNVSLPSMQPVPANKVVQVGNMLQIVPTEHIPMPSVPPPSSSNQKILQVGNMLQIVPQNLSPPRHFQKVAQEPSSASEVAMDKPSIEEVMKQKIAERRAEREKRRSDREKRRKEKEKRRKEKEKQKQIKLKIRTENMIKKALQQEQEGEMDEDDPTDEFPVQWPPTPIIFKESSKEVGKSILLKSGAKSLDLDDSRIRKCVQFADGVRPGEGTSPSGGEELSSPPPAKAKLPKEKRYKKTKVPKKSKKKKIKVKVVKRQEESDEEDHLPPPSPPPGSPPPSLFPPRIKTHSINNLHPHFAPVPTASIQPGVHSQSIPLPIQSNPSAYQHVYRPPVSMGMPPPVARQPPPHVYPPPPPMSPMNMYNAPRAPPGGSPWT